MKVSFKRDIDVDEKGIQENLTRFLHSVLQTHLATDKEFWEMFGGRAIEMSVSLSLEDLKTEWDGVDEVITTEKEFIVKEQTNE